ncbi:hypothetical protein RSOLAG22IIIB_06546 [Rhizoctonia solani]|uniref:Uncharacterized protein n=1 Tax=Rhizoctonia solani TaxID=456999 RepID=A0A0K6GEY7_9AGAM|nr:hypothetical protein RSOLAG22IIIB_06546 [Rhizoctonia solani]
MVYNAVFIAYLLLSNFELIGEKERWTVEVIVELTVSYNLDLGRIDMSRDVFGKVRILLPQLCLLAARYGYLYTETEIGFNNAHRLLLAIVDPLVAHLCVSIMPSLSSYATYAKQPYEHDKVKSTISDARDLLDLPLAQLRSLVQQWYSNNFEIVLQTAPLPRSSQPPATNNEPRSLKIRSIGAKRYGLVPEKTREELNSERLKGSLNLNLRVGERPKLSQFRSTNVSREELARREWPLSPVTLCSVSTSDSQELSTPSSYWDTSFESMDSSETPSGLFGQRFKKGLKAFFSSSS